MSSANKLAFYLGGGTSPLRSGSPASPRSPTTGGGAFNSHGNKKFPSLTAKERWHDVMRKMKLQMAHLGRSPMVPVSKIESLKTLFTDARSGKLIELDHDTFCESMSEALKGRNFTQDELSKWFSDMDVDLSNGVSWEEFTSFMISAASSFGEENVRSKEFLPDLIASTPTSVMHKDSVKRLVTNKMCPYVISGGYDGLVKLWRPQNGGHVFSINNNIYSAAHEAIPAGSVVPVSPIMDIAFNMRGTHCFVAAADRSVNIYDGKTFSLTRKFVGVVADSIETAYWKPNHLGCDGVPDINSKRFAAAASGITTSFRSVESAEVSLLLSMTETPSTLDIATPLENEVLFFGTHDGSIMAYPSLRHSVLPDIPKLAHYRDIHTEPISKMRYEPKLRALITASWDTSICLTSPETGQCIHRLPGHNQQAQDYGSNMVSDTLDIGHKKIALDFAFSPAHHLLATVGADRSVLLWNPMFRLPVASLRGHSGPLCSVAVDEIDNLLLTMDICGVVKTWDLRMNRCLQTIGGSGSESGGGGGGASSQSSATSASAECKLDTPSAMIYAPEHHRIFCAGRSLSSYTVRRAQTHFHPTHIGHCEGIISYAAFPDTSSIVTADANVLMRWNVRNGKRQSLWDINPPSADGGDMLTRASDAGSGSGLVISSQQKKNREGKQQQEDPSAAAAAAAQKISTIACFERDASQRRIFAMTMDGALISFNPTNGQELRRLELASYLTDEPFRVVHLCNAHNTLRAIAVVTAREAIFVSEDIDEVTGLMPYGPFGRVLAPKTTVSSGTASGPLASQGPVQQCFFSAVAAYPPVGASTLPSLVLGSTEGHLQVIFPLSQECTTSVIHPPPRSNTRQSSHRRHRNSSSHRTNPAAATTTTSNHNNNGSFFGGSTTTMASTTLHRGGGAATPSVAGSGGSSLVSSAVEDIVYLKSLDLFITCVGDNHMFFWDLRSGQLKMQFCTNLQPEECILSLASGEDSEPFVSYDTALSKKGAAVASFTGGTAGAGGVSLKHMIKKRSQAGANGGILGVKGTIKSFSQLLEEALMLRDDGTLGLVVNTEGIGEAQTGYITDNLVDDEERRQNAVSNKQKQDHLTTNHNTSRRHRLLISGCDWGFVYVWDVSRIPASTAPASAFLGGLPMAGNGSFATPPAAAQSAYGPPVLLSVFRAHNAPITRLSFFDTERLLCTMSTVDCYVKTFHLKGSYVGHFGQRMPYWFRDATTFGADAFSVAMDDTSQQTPRYPPSSAPSTAPSNPVSKAPVVVAAGRRRASGQTSPMPSSATILQTPKETPNVPISAAALTGGGATSRPSTRQLDSPAASLFNSSFFATSVPKTILGKHAVESPHDMSSFAQVPAGVDAFEGAVSAHSVMSPSFAAFSTSGGAKVAFPLSTGGKRRTSLGGAGDGSNRSPHGDSDRATPSADFGASTSAAYHWTSPTSALTEEELKAAKELSRSVAPKGLAAKEGESNLRPLLFRKKRLSIRATSTETLEQIQQRKPRHTASVVGDVHMFLKSSPRGDDDALDGVGRSSDGDPAIGGTTSGEVVGHGRRRTTLGRRRVSHDHTNSSDNNNPPMMMMMPLTKRRSSRSSSPMQSLEPLNVPVFLDDDTTTAGGNLRKGVGGDGALMSAATPQHQRHQSLLLSTPQRRSTPPILTTPPSTTLAASAHSGGGGTTPTPVPQSLLVPPPALRALLVKTPTGSDGGGGHHNSGHSTPLLQQNAITSSFSTQAQTPRAHAHSGGTTTVSSSSPLISTLQPSSTTAATVGLLGTPRRAAAGALLASTKPPPSPKFGSFGGAAGGGQFMTPRTIVNNNGTASPSTPMYSMFASNEDPLAGSFGARRKPPLAPPPPPASPLGHLVAATSEINSGGGGSTSQFLQQQPMSNTSSTFVTPRGPDRSSTPTPRVLQQQGVDGSTPQDIRQMSGIPVLKGSSSPAGPFDGDDGEDDALFTQWSITAGAGSGGGRGGGGGFLLTALDDNDERGAVITQRHSEQHAGGLTRSHSVPLSRRLPDSVSVLTRSSDKYRSRTSLSMLPTDATVGPQDPHHHSSNHLHKSLFGSPAASHSSFPASPSQSPSSSPRRRPHFVGGLERSVVHKATAILHHAAVAQSNRKGDTSVEHRVDRVTRLIRDRELLKYHPLMIRSSLLQDNDSMKEEVAIMPSAWTSRASSLLKTHDFELQDIQRRFWSPKGKEISKAKLLKWNTDPNSMFGADPRKQQQQQQQQQAR